MLTFPAMLALVAVTVAIFIALLAARLAKATASRPHALLVPVALMAALYALGDLGTYAALPASRAVLAQQVGVFGGLLHVAAWLRFSDAHLGLEGAATRLWAVFVGLAALVLVPGLAYTGATRSRAVPSFGLVYHEAEATPLGIGLLVLAAVGLLVVGLRYAAATRRGVPGAGSLVIAFGLYAAVAAHDIVATHAALETPALLDVAFILPLGVAVWLLADRFVIEARALDRERGELARAAEQRAREIDETAAAIAREARLASLGGFAGAVAHAINNPVSVAAANLTHVLEAARADGHAGDRREALRDTREALDRIGQITRQLLRASRLAAAPTGGDVGIEEAIARAEAVAREQGRDPGPVAREIEGDLRVSLDAPVLGEVLANLIAELDDRGADARVRARPVLGGRVEIEVAPAECDGPASRPERPITPAGELRLSMCRALLVGHGADLSVHAVPGGGTRFVVELPRAGGGRAEGAAP